MEFEIEFKLERVAMFLIGLAAGAVIGYMLAEGDVIDKGRSVLESGRARLSA